MSENKVKPQLHQSQLNDLYRCGEKFRRKVLNGEREPSTTPLVIGISGHKAVAINLNHKIKTRGRLMRLDRLKDVAREAFVETWNGSSIVFNKDERKLGLRRVRGKGIDRTVAGVTEHNKKLAPKIHPKKNGIERKWVLTCEGYPYDLAGQIDIVEKGNVIRDNKFRSRSITQREVDTSDQFTLYAMAIRIIDRARMPIKVWLDGIINTPKTNKTRVASLHSRRTLRDFAIFKNRFENACQIIEKEAFTPASRSDWWCDTRFCGFAADGSCPYFSRGRKTFLPPNRKIKKRR